MARLGPRSVNTMRARGITSVRSIAEGLNDKGIRAPPVDTWDPTAFSRLLARLSLTNAYVDFSRNLIASRVAKGKP
jgi:hypothetical protein